MKKTIFWFLVGISLSLHAQQTLQGRSFFSTRSQSTNAARELVGWHPYIHRWDRCLYGALSATPNYSQSFRPNRIADALFGTDQLAISGSLVPNREATDILADYFGLSQEFVSCVSLNPLIQNAIVDLNLFLGFNSILHGLFFRIHAPYVWSRWNFRMTEEIADSGVDTPYVARYMDSGTVTPPVSSFMQALRGGFTFGQQTIPLQFARVCDAQTETGFSDVQMALGWDFILNQCGHAGVSLRVAAPTGSRPNGCFFFEPIVGNGKHWEAGVGFTGRLVMWEKDGCQFLKFFADVNIMHLFAARQRRTFDLCENGFGSRYILVKEFDADGNYTGNFTPLVNITTLSCDVSNDIQLDMVFMFSYLHNQWLFDIGYEGWIRSHEKISLNECIADNRWGLKGIQNVVIIDDFLSGSTQSMATLQGNPFADQLVVGDPNPPVFIRTQDINLRSAASPLVLTHKLFGHMNYSFREPRACGVVPFFGIGGEIEFEGINTSVDVEPYRNTLSQWSLWVKGGIGF